MNVSLPLGEVFAKETGSLDPRKFKDETFDLFSVPSYEGGAPDVVPGRNIGSQKVKVLPGDVLLCKIVPHIRRAWVVPEAGVNRQIASGEWIVLRDSRLHPGYLRHFLLGDAFHRQFMATVAGVGGSLMRARPAQAGRITIPLPPLPEQRRIAEILDRADELRTKRRQALTLLDELGTSLFERDFGPDSKWPKISLLELCEARSGGTPSKSISEYWRGAIPWFSPKDLKQNELEDSIDHISDFALGETSLNLFPANTAVIVVRGMILAHSLPVSLITVPFAMNQDMKALIPRIKTEPQYLAFALRAQKAAVLSEVSNAGHGTKRLETKILARTRIPHPPFSVQQDFGNRIRDLLELRKRAKLHLFELEELFTSLQHRGFRGDL